MRKKHSIFQGFCLAVLFILIGVCTYYFVKLQMIDETGMNETGLATVFLLVTGVLLIIYTTIYTFEFIRFLKGKNAKSFHHWNKNTTGMVFLALVCFIIITGRIFYLVYMGPIALLMLLLFASSYIYLKDKTLKVN